MNPIWAPVGAAQLDSLPVRLRGGDLILPTLADGRAMQALADDALTPQLYLIQFNAPIQDDWLAAARMAGISLVQYVPDYSYIVWAQAGQVQALAAQAPLYAAAVYQPAYALHPDLAGRPAADASLVVDVQVQWVDLPALDATRLTLEKTALVVLRPAAVVQSTGVMGLRVLAADLPALAALPGVINIEPLIQPQRHDEVQAMIMAGALNISGTLPTGPGYLAWLADKGFSTDPAAYPIVDITDDGIDNGSELPLHADFYVSGNPALPDRLIYNHNWTNDALADGLHGHGNINAGIMGGYNAATGSAYEDAQGYNLGLGINPFGRIAGSKVFNNGGSFDTGNAGYDTILSNSYARGARISSNSWGISNHGDYSIDDQTYDALVRDASALQTGLQAMLVVFSAGNDGPNLSTTGSPGNAKNVLTVGASENVRPGWQDGCLVPGAGADNAQQIIDFSSRGPTQDGRTKPDLIAPGTHIQGAASQAPGYTGGGVCDAYYPAGQTLYAASSGTSHSTPAVAGAASLVVRYYQDHFSGQSPSPAMIKAYLINATRYLNGAGGENLPSPHQGFGSVDLGRAFDGATRALVDQAVLLGHSGELYSLPLRIADSGAPLRVTLAWTDAPGATVGAAYVNNLNLEVLVNGQTYYGNVFSGSLSQTGGAADTRNNVESVFLAPGLSGDVTVRVRAFNLAGDGVPGNGDATDQDFALVVYNAGEITGDLTGSITASPGGEPLPAARLQALGNGRTFRTTLDAGGVYTLPLPAGVYTATAWQYGYTPQIVAGIVISEDQTSTQDFSLSLAAAAVLNGCVSDAVTSQPLAATLSVFGPFGDPITQTAVTQASHCYNLALPAGPYRVTAEASLHSGQDVSLDVTGSTTHDFLLQPTTSQGRFYGMVRALPGAAPLPNASLTLTAPDWFGYYRYLSASNGQFDLLADPGFYTVTVSAPFYASLTTTLTIPQSNLVQRDFELPSARLDVQPSIGVSLSLTVGQVLSVPLTLSNHGLATLNYHSYAVLSGTLNGPTDLYGYRLLDSRTSAGVSYDWVDVSGSTQLGLLDDGEINLTLPFTFTYYGRTSNILRVGNNGAALFGVTGGDIAFTNSPMVASGADYVMAPFWDDLDSSAGWVAYQTLGTAPDRRLVVQWYRRPHFNKIGQINFQLILYERTHNIKFQYQDVLFENVNFDRGISASVGLRGYGPFFSQVGYNQAVLDDGMALCFQAAGQLPCDLPVLSWLQLIQPTGELSAGAAITTTLRLDTNELPAGMPASITQAELWFASNDPTQQPGLVLPITISLPPHRHYLPLIVTGASLSLSNR